MDSSTSLDTFKKIYPLVLTAILSVGGGVGYTELRPKSDSVFTEVEKVELLNQVSSLKEQVGSVKEQLTAVKAVNPALIDEKLNNMKEQLNRIEKFIDEN